MNFSTSKTKMQAKIEVNKEDMGLLIGKEGKTIRSIRSLVRAKAIKDGVRVKVEIVEKE